MLQLNYEFQTSLLNYRDKLENRNLTCIKFTHNTFEKAINKGADQTARVCRVVWECAVCKPPKFFYRRGTYKIHCEKPFVGAIQ